MISRKTPKADLENKRSSWRALGFIASLSIVLVALSWTSYDVAIRQALNFEADLLEDEEIPQLRFCSIHGQKGGHEGMGGAGERQLGRGN